MIDVVMHVGAIGEAGPRGERRAGAWRDRQELQADIVDFGAVLADRPDGILLQHRVAFDGAVEVALELRDGQPGRRTAAAFFALIGDAPVVRLVVALEGQQGVGRRRAAGRCR